VEICRNSTYNFDFIEIGVRDMKEKLKSLQGLLTFIISIAPVVLLIITFISGVEWYWKNIISQAWFFDIYWISLILFILSLLVSLIKKTRFAGTVMLMIISLIFGALTWMFSLGTVWVIWGLVAVIIGLFIVGIGIVPAAVLATLFTGSWQALLFIAIGIVSFIIPRLLAAFFANKADEEEAEIYKPKSMDNSQ
jgi:hypothetical protein